MKALVTGGAVLCVLAGFSVAVAVGSGAATGQWASTSAVKTSMLSAPLRVLWCDPSASACVVDPSTGYLAGYRSIKVGVLRVKLRGVGAAHVVNGQRRFQRFEVWMCARNYLDGGAQVGAHLLWHTKRPPSQTTTVSGGIKTVATDDGAAYAEDWTQRGVDPIVRSDCPSFG